MRAGNPHRHVLEVTMRDGNINLPFTTTIFDGKVLEVTMRDGNCLFGFEHVAYCIPCFRSDYEGWKRGLRLFFFLQGGYPF